MHTRCSMKDLKDLDYVIMIKGISCKYVWGGRKGLKYFNTHHIPRLILRVNGLRLRVSTPNVFVDRGQPYLDHQRYSKVPARCGMPFQKKD